MNIIKWILKGMSSILLVPYLLVLFLSAIYVRIFKSNPKDDIRLVWGSAPIINNKYWSKSMQQKSYKSDTFVSSYLSVINKKDDWDYILTDKYKFIPYPFKCYIAFIESLFKYDVFFISFKGFFIGHTLIGRLQHLIFKIADKKVVVIPYGSDSYVYRRVKSTTLLHGLLMSYPEAARQQNKIKEKVEYWIKHANVVIPGSMGQDGFGRWDVLTPSTLSIDTSQWLPSEKRNTSNGSPNSEPIVVAHTPNHRGFKGTEFLVSAINDLKKEGFNVKLCLIENMQNEEVRKILQSKADILVEQLIMGYALSAIEGMACGIPVISNLTDENYTLPFKRWSFLGECPIVSASPETVKDELRNLITNPELRQDLGNKSRDYVMKYHSLEASGHLFTNVLQYLYGEKESLINLYHPLLSQDKSSNT